MKPRADHRLAHTSLADDGGNCVVAKLGAGFHGQWLDTSGPRLLGEVEQTGWTGRQ